MSDELFPPDADQVKRAKLTKRGWYQIGVGEGGHMLWQAPGGISLPEPDAFSLLERMEKASTPPEAGV